MRKILLLLIFVLTLFSGASLVAARDNVDYWYVKDFKSEIVVNKDSSLDITEMITADCGSAQKHGIFRVLPIDKKISKTLSINMPVKLESITDFDNKPIQFTATKDSKNKTITWKIGDPNITVTGVNYYKIKYHVENTILASSDNFDEFYWNLSGNFWDIPIDNFEASIIFPEGINKDNSEINLYSGLYGETNALDAKAEFVEPNKLDVYVASTIDAGSGVTVSVAFPKNIVIPHIPSFIEKYGVYFYFLLPLVVFIVCLKFWSKYGRDPKINPTIAPEFEIPEKLCPIDMGMILTDGHLKNTFISASIINLAVNGKIKIRKIEKSGVFAKEDFELTKVDGKAKISDSDQLLLGKLFGSEKSIKISSLKNVFYKEIPKISDSSKTYLAGKKWLNQASRTWQGCLIALSVVSVISWGIFGAINITLMLASMMTGVVLFIFSFLMRSRTKQGAELLRRVKGFKLYMDTAEKYRQRFNEKENIFEKFLPYAIVFGIAKEWTKKMKDIYGEEYFNNYHPVWFVGPSLDTFNIDSVASEISTMSSSMTSTISSAPSSSGSGGGGFSGGGGGGGGGGGW